MCGFFLLLHNLILVYTRDECDTGLFEVNLMLAVDVADGEDLTVELSCLPVHSAGSIHLDDPDFGSAFNHHLNTVPKTAKTLIVEKKPL